MKKADQKAFGTMLRVDKGPVIPPPMVKGILKVITDAVSKWPRIITTTHWDPFNPTVVDGVDFYYGEEELGHIHLDGSAHIATSLKLGKELIAQGLAKPFRYTQGWIEEDVHHNGAEAAIELFLSNYKRLLGEK